MNWKRLRNRVLIYSKGDIKRESVPKIPFFMANGNKNTQSVPKTDLYTSKGNKTLKFVPLTYYFPVLV